MFFHSGVIIAPSGNYKAANQVKDEIPTLKKVPRKMTAAKKKNNNPNLEKFPKKTTTTKRRFSARLRKMRWAIYNTNPSRRRKLTRILKHYKKLVKQFLEEFSSKLKPKEIPIWKEKVDKTVEDVQMVLKNEKVSKFRGKSRDKKEVNKVQTCQSCTCAMSKYVVSIENVLVMVSAFLQLVNMSKAEPVVQKNAEVSN